MSPDAEFSNEVRVLPGGPEHVEAIAALAEVVWRAHYPAFLSPGQIDYMLGRMYDPEVMRGELAEGIQYFRLQCGGVLVGFASCGPTAVEREMKLHKLYVHPQWQRRGLGSVLLKQVLNAARVAGAARLILAVNKANRQAIAAYEKNSFRILAAVTVEIGHGYVMDDYIMERELGDAAT